MKKIFKKFHRKSFMIKKHFFTIVSICPSMCPSFHLYVHLSTYMSICPPICPSVHLYVLLSIISFVDLLYICTYIVGLDTQADGHPKGERKLAEGRHYASSYRKRFQYECFLILRKFRRILDPPFSSFSSITTQIFVPVSYSFCLFFPICITYWDYSSIT